MNKKNFIKLARLVAKFAEVKTDKGVLIFDNELAAGVEVTNEEGEAVEDGEYILEDGRTVVIAESKVVEIKEVEDAKKAEETPEETLEEALEEVTPEEPAAEPDPKDAEIEQLKAKIAEYEATIEQLNNKIKELEDAAEAPKEEPIQMSAVAQSHKTSGALKYFA